MDTREELIDARMAWALFGARLRTEHPDWSEHEASRQLLRLTLADTVLPPQAELFRPL